MIDDGATNFDTNISRSQVSFDVNENKPDCAMVVPGEGMTMLNLNAECHHELVARELIEGFDFEPKCLVLVLAMENEKEMFDSMVSAGRLMTDPFVSQSRNSNLRRALRPKRNTCAVPGDPRLLYGGDGRPPRRQAREHQLPQRKDSARQLHARQDGPGGDEQSAGVARQRHQVHKARRGHRKDDRVHSHGHV